MKRSILTAMALCLGFLVCAAMNPARAQEKKEGQITGTVRMMDKANSTITIRHGNTDKQVVYNADTKWMYGRDPDAKPSSLDQLKEGWHITCNGKFDGVKLVASA